MGNRWLWRNLLQVCAGILLVAAASWLVTYSSDCQKESAVRPGWLMVRAPGNLQTVALCRGSVWAGGVQGLFRFDAATAKALPVPAGAGELGAVHDLLSDSSGRLWVAHQYGVACYDGAQWQVCPPLPGNSPAAVTALLQDRDGAMWLGLAAGVLCRGAAGERFFPLDMGPVDVLYQDRQGHVWAGSSDPRRGGLACFDGHTWRAYGVADGLVHPSVTCMLQARDGTLWLGTGFAQEGGANYFTASGELRRLTRQDGLAGEKVRQIYEDQAGNLWFCSEYDGVAVFREGRRVAVLTVADGLAGQEVKKIVQDDTGDRKSVV